MKPIFFLSTFFLLFFIGYDAQAQCPKGKVLCEGECGRFVDEDGDGFCDAPKAKQETQKDNKEENKTENVDMSLSVSQNDTANGGIVMVGDEMAVEAKVEEIVNPEALNSHSKATTHEKEEEVEEAKKEEEKPYRLLGITIITLVSYFFTMMLVKTGKMKKFVHRRIWNTILLITFLMSCLLGLLLVIQLNYHILSSLYLANLKLHVEFGIAMTIISIIHILWHLPYFKKLLKTQKSALKDIVNE